MAFPVDHDEAVLQAALHIAEKRMRYGKALTSPEAVRTYLKIWAASLAEEEFGAIWLTTKHQVIQVDVLATGTIDGANVYPRVVIKAGLATNAGAVILFHNHPSGEAEPSQADKTLTVRLKEALSYVDIRLLDHLVIGNTIESFAEKGWL